MWCCALWLASGHAEEACQALEKLIKVLLHMPGNPVKCCMPKNCYIRSWKPIKRCTSEEILSSATVTCHSRRAELRHMDLIFNRAIWQLESWRLFWVRVNSVYSEALLMLCGAVISVIFLINGLKWPAQINHWLSNLLSNKCVEFPHYFIWLKLSDTHFNRFVKFYTKSTFSSIPIPFGVVLSDRCPSLIF